MSDWKPIKSAEDVTNEHVELAEMWRWDSDEPRPWYEVITRIEMLRSEDWGSDMGSGAITALKRRATALHKEDQ